MISHVDCTIRIGSGLVVDLQSKESIFGKLSTSTIDDSSCNIQRCASTSYTISTFAEG
jgi:hypothetical protein